MILSKDALYVIKYTQYNWGSGENWAVRDSCFLVSEEPLNENQWIFKRKSKTGTFCLITASFDPDGRLKTPSAGLGNAEIICISYPDNGDWE